ncbi:pyridoxal phosphate-dependent aminotransferase [Chloroflexus aggregans]|uniref:Aminotransferase class I and II n=1 Tax=Chloroflexus aggregans (strain MD-66 / DSM 9485) TaxID=326427 RepID=B8G7D3_CHLAD|nr:pyridoxal phosphate-dependent aminotransferase [Chloroflexus aggregans]ACL25968.1 aminotransferase class I and II [Chloroflexus aggregans DSM 9485]
MAGVFTQLDLSPNRLEVARQARAARGDLIDLTSSNPTTQGLLFPPEVLATAAAKYWTTRCYRPDPHGDLAAREAIVAYYARRTPPLVLTPDDIFLTASTSEAYSLLFALLADPGDNLLVPNVTYPLFEYLAALRNLELRSYQLDEDRDWRINARSLRRAVDDRTRAILIISPHNPTGAIVEHALATLDLLGVPIICDEVFAPFTYAAPSTPPLAALHPDLPVFTLNGISKLFALPDLKLGWIALNRPARAFAARLELLNDTLLGANALSQFLLPTLFASGEAFVTAMVERVRTNLTFALQRFADHPRIHARSPSGGYYLFPSISGWDDEEALALYLLEQGVFVHPGYFYGDVPGCHIMLSALTEPPVFVAGVERLCVALAG